MLIERAELRLDRGELLRAAADFHAALASHPPDALAKQAREKLFATLTQLLSRDFTRASRTSTNIRPCVGS